MSDMVTIDYLYCANWSLWLDAKILARTIPYVLSRRSPEFCRAYARPALSTDARLARTGPDTLSARRDERVPVAVGVTPASGAARA